MARADRIDLEALALLVGGGVAEPEEPDMLYTIEEAAERLWVSRSLIYTLMRTGQLDSVKIGHRRFIPVAEVIRIIGEADAGNTPAA